MKAIVYKKYGPPEVLRIEEMERPVPKENEVLIRVHATTVTATDCIFRRGDSFFPRLFTGLFKPKNRIPGDSLSGVIEAVGEKVTRFKAGDPVFGTSHQGFGAHAEYVCLAENGTLARKPSNIDHGGAAAICDGGLTALPFLRDTGNIQSGQRVLINGASGGIGTFAVQLAKHSGTEVTGVCSKGNIELAKSLGADHVIDYNEEDFTQTGETYNIVFDTVGKTSFSRCRGSLKEKGVFLEAAFNPWDFPLVLWTSQFGGKKAKIAATGLRPPADRAKDLVFLRELTESGKLQPVIDKVYPLEQIIEAHRHVDTGHKRGNVVVQFVET